MKKSLYRRATPEERQRREEFAEAMSAPSRAWPFPAAAHAEEEAARVKPVKPPKGAKKKAKR